MNLAISLIDHESPKHDPEEISKLKKMFGPDGGGMLHPVPVRAVGNRYKLITGSKRLQAFKELGLSIIPAIEFESTKPDREIQLEENLGRYNIPWYEQVELELEFHNLRVAKHGAKVNGRPKISSQTQGWSQADTARELGLSMGAMSQDLALANALKRNPHLSKVKDKITALKLIKQTTKREQAEEEALSPIDVEMDQILLGDSSEILKSFAANTFDACITDPPWLSYKEERLTKDESTYPVFAEVYRVLKNDAFLYAVVSTDDFYWYRSELPKLGFRVQNYPIIWAKTGTMTHGRRAWEYARDFEPILLAVKGNPVLAISTELSGILSFPAVHNSKIIHPHEKPIELLKTILRHCSYEGSKILDPFAGSGVTLEAARALKRKYIGIERDRTFFTNIEKRLSK